MDLETLWYEFSPYVYAVAGIASVASTRSTVGIVSGVLLLAAAATIFRLRWTYRRKLDQKVQKPF